MDRKSLGVDRFELGSLSGDSQEHFSDLSHAGKTSDLRSQLNTDDFKLVEWRSGVLRSREVCLSNTGVEESLMSDLSLDVKAELVTDSSACKGLCSRRGAGRIRHIHCPALWLQHAVARRQIAITRRAGKDLAPDVGTKAGIPEGHHVATAGNVWTGQGRRSSEASFEHGRSASEGLRTWLRHVCTTNFEHTFPCFLDQALCRLRWMSFRDHCSLAPKKCL